MENRSYHGFAPAQASVLRSASDYPVPVIDAGAQWFTRLLWLYCNGIRRVRLAPGEFRSPGELVIPANMTVIGSGHRTIVASPDGYNTILEAGSGLEYMQLVCGKAPSGGGLLLGADSTVVGCYLFMPEPHDLSGAPDAIVCAQGTGAVVVDCEVSFLSHKGAWTLDSGSMVAECNIDLGVGRTRVEGDAVLIALNPTVRVLGNRFIDNAATPAAYVAMYLVDGCVATGNDCGFDASDAAHPFGQIWIPSTAAMCPVTENVAYVITY